MNKERPNKINNSSESKTFDRPKKSTKDDTLASDVQRLENEQLQSELEDADLASSPWHSLAMFCNASYEEFIPKYEDNQKNQAPVAQVHKRCVDLLIKAKSDTWEEIVERYFYRYPNERLTAINFFFYLSRRDSDSPLDVLRQLKMNLTQFVELAEYAFTYSENRDLVKLDMMVDVIGNYQGSERTFLFLSELPWVLDDESRSIIQSSKGYKTILRWGGSVYLKSFWSRLQQKFRLTRVAIKNEVAQNLARELGETETNLSTQLELLKIENEELKNTIQLMRSQALQEAVCKFAKTLQDQPEPVLDQIVFLQQRLQKKSEEGLPLSSADSLSVLIALEALLKAFKSLEIKQFPDDTSLGFELQSEQLGEYSYVEGSAFADSEDKKIVRCIRPGWRVGKIIVTSARVKEVPEES